MGIMDWAAWCVIAGLSFISIGGLLIWAYGDAVSLRHGNVSLDSPALAARRSFTSLVIYSIGLLVLGLGFLVQGTLFILSGA